MELLSAFREDVKNNAKDPENLKKVCNALKVPKIEGDKDKQITDLVKVLNDFRDKIKSNANTDFKTIFKHCDELRDEILPNIGVLLKDKKGDKAIWYLEDREVIQ